MKRLWLVFSQTVTVLLAAWFVVATLKPQWLHRPPAAGPVVAQVQHSAPVSAAGVGGDKPISFRNAARTAAPSVVSINTTKEVRHPRSNDPWFQFFFGDPGSQLQQGLGSGVVVSTEGYVLTNNHVVEGADEIGVVSFDGRTARARLVGTDPETDLAVLRIDLPDLPVIAFGDSDALEVGDQVLAIGNPFGVGQTVTSGIVSAIGRNQLGINTFENFIQTDAAINPGNSGGALVDVDGRLLGINTAIYSRSGGNMGIGFAIPVATAKQVLESIVQNGHVTRGWVGIETSDLTSELARTFGAGSTSGALVTGVLQDGPAARAGLLPGDIITTLDGSAVSNSAGLLAMVAALQPQRKVMVQVWRRGERLQFEIAPGVRPPVNRTR